MSTELNYLREFEGFRLDPERKILWADNEPVTLPLKEIEILCVLTGNEREVVTKDELLDRVWGDSFVEESNLSQHIYRLRKTFQRHGASADLIQTIPRRGYRFTGNVTVIENEHVVIEKRTLTRTVIEQIHSSDPSGGDSAIAAVHRQSRIRSGFATTAFAVVAVIGSAIWFYLGLSPSTDQKEPIRTVAVLPFRSSAIDDKSVQLGSQLADELTSRLSGLSQIKVRPATAVHYSLASMDDPIEIGKKLDVQSVIDGTVSKIGDRLLLSIRLMNVSDQSIAWSKVYERRTGNESNLQAQVAADLVERLALKLTNHELSLLSRQSTDNFEAHSLYFQGRFHWNTRSIEGAVEARRLFTSASALDPNFALAYVGIADTYLFQEYSPEAAVAIHRAFELDPNLPEAYASRGFLNMFHGWSWDAAEADLKRAIELKPGYIPARQWYGTLLMIRGRPEEAQAQLVEALEIDPQSYNLLADLAQAYYVGGDFRSAEEYCIRALTINPNFLVAHTTLQDVYIQIGDDAKAFATYRRVSMLPMKQLSPSENYHLTTENATSPVERAFQTGGMRGVWKLIAKISSQATSGNANEYIGIAKANIKLGNNDKAIENLKKAKRGRAFLFPFVKSDPFFIPVSEDPRFKALMSEVGLS